MTINIIFAIAIYFLIGLILFNLIEPRQRKKNIYMFFITYLIALVTCLLYYFSWLVLGLEAHKGVEGLFSVDSSSYYLQAIQIKSHNFSSDAFDRVITDHYHPLFLAVQLYIFGEHVLIPKVYQVLLFSISVVLWVSIVRDILKNKKLTNYFYLLLLFCVPLLTYNAHVLKEISLFFATSVTVYGFSKYTYVNSGNSKYLWVILIGLILMFMFRREFAIIIFLSMIVATLLGSGLSFKKKMMWISISIASVVILSLVPFFTSIGALNPLVEEGGSLIIGRGESGERVRVGTGGQGMVAGLLFILTNPLLLAPIFIYGVLMVFFHPPFLMTPNELIERSAYLCCGGLDYMTMGYYNFFFVLMLPAFAFGLWYLYKNRWKDPVLLTLILYFSLSIVAIIFQGDSYRRFKSSFFWPIAYIYISYGIATYSIWKKYIPLVLFIGVLLLFMYFSFDLIGFATV